MNFSDTLKRLRDAAQTAQRGEHQDFCRIRRVDLSELLHNFDIGAAVLRQRAGEDCGGSERAVLAKMYAAGKDPQ